MATEKARQEVLSRARRLDGIRDAAHGKERELASRRAEVGDAVAGQRTLLSKVNSEIADLMEAQRRAELEAARQPTTSAPADNPNRGRIIGGVSGGVTPDSPDEEPTGPPPPVKGGAGTAVSAAAAQIGKPYEWAAEGPDSFDCSGLTMFAWGKAGVSLPHSSGAQYASLPHVSRAQLRAGDLVFFGSPIHHVGIYEGGGVMINAPETGENVRRDSIGRADYAGAARP
jgi:cell wall-associated NlpC family hydrolase